VICPICNGKGVPGTFLIDEIAFNRYVYPLIQKITQTVEQSSVTEEKEKQDGIHFNGAKLYGNKNGLST